MTDFFKTIAVLSTLSFLVQMVVWVLFGVYVPAVLMVTGGMLVVSLAALALMKS